MAQPKLKSKQKQSNPLSKQGKPQQERKGYSLLCLPFSQMPGSMNSKYLISLSMAMNVILLTSLVYEKNYHVMPEKFMGEGKSLVNQICVPHQETEANHVCAIEGQTSCSGNGYYVDQNPSQPSSGGGFCKCHACFTGHNCSSVVNNCIINLDHGDPTMFESFWIKNGQKSTTVILGWQVMSYMVDVSNICWFLEPELAKEIRSLHSLVGNAVTKGRHIVIGTGSTQLFQAALYALSPRDHSKPTSVVSAAPYYSSYPLVTDYLKSEIYRWAGDAWNFSQTSDEDFYIELVTSPNNPDGFAREAVVNGSGPVIYDLAYYWPHYTPITAPANHDLMLFTVSKSTGHAGSRIGWAIVKDVEVAKKMTKYIELNTIGVSKDSQLRATQILHSVSNSYASENIIDTQGELSIDQEDRFFHHGSSLMTERWKRLRGAVSLNHRFSLPEFEPAFCNFFGRLTTAQPAFAWLKCEGKEDEDKDCEKLLRSNGIITRSGRHFGAPPTYVRLSILDRNQTFNILIDRLSSIH
eukprot:Gb_19963 [translate_table: standard]